MQLHKMVLTLALLSACATSVKLEDRDMTLIKAEQMTQTDVVARYGKPKAKMATPAGCKGKPGEMLTYGATGPGFVERHSEYVSLIFDAQGRFCEAMTAAGTYVPAH